MIRAVIFDMDGVLVDTEWFYNRRRVAYLATKGITFDEIPDLSGSYDEAIWRFFVPDDDEKRERLAREYKEVYSPQHPAPFAELMNDGARDVFFELSRAGFKTAIASSSYRELIDEFIEVAGIADVLDLALSGHECPAFKPDPAIYTLAMERLGVTPDQTLVIEDSPTGIIAGKRAKAEVWALRPREGVHLDQHEADRVIDSLRAIPEELRRNS